MHQVLLVVSLGIVGVVLVPYARHRTRQADLQEVVQSFRRASAGLQGYYDDVRTLSPLNGASGGLLEPHLLEGDPQGGWQGPYLGEPLVSAFGGSFSVRIQGTSQAWIVLGPKEALGKDYGPVLRLVNAALDGDDDLTRGQVWEGSEGIHLGFNYVKR